MAILLPSAQTIPSPLITGRVSSAGQNGTSPLLKGSLPLPGLVEPASSAWRSTSGNHPPHHPELSKQRLGHLGKAAALITGTLLLKKLPGRASSNFRLFSTDWKEWAKVLLAIGGLGEIQKAANWQPPVWLSAMMNVAVVTPLISKFNLQNVIQGVVLSPLVGGLASLNHYLGEKAEQPAEKYLQLPATVTRLALSALTTLTGLAILPKVGRAIPLPAKSWPGQSKAPSLTNAETAARAGAGTICANGCCASLICANEMGQIGSAMLSSYQARQHERKAQS